MSRTFALGLQDNCYYSMDQIVDLIDVERSPYIWYFRFPMSCEVLDKATR